MSDWKCEGPEVRAASDVSAGLVFSVGRMAEDPLLASRRPRNAGAKSCCFRFGARGPETRVHLSALSLVYSTQSLALVPLVIWY